MDWSNLLVENFIYIKEAQAAQGAQQNIVEKIKNLSWDQTKPGLMGSNFTVLICERYCAYVVQSTSYRCYLPYISFNLPLN